MTPLPTDWVHRAAGVPAKCVQNVCATIWLDRSKGSEHYVLVAQRESPIRDYEAYTLYRWSVDLKSTMLSGTFIYRAPRNGGFFHAEMCPTVRATNTGQFVVTRIDE